MKKATQKAFGLRFTWLICTHRQRQTDLLCPGPAHPWGQLEQSPQVVDRCVGRPILVHPTCTRVLLHPLPLRDLKEKRGAEEKRKDGVLARALEWEKRKAHHHPMVMMGSIWHAASGLRQSGLTHPPTDIWTSLGMFTMFTEHWLWFM